ncbi:MAG: peptidase S10 [Planctomycetota bacterium]
MQTTPSTTPSDESPTPAEAQPAYKSQAVTEHVVGGTRFRVTAAELEMKDDAGVTRGTMFFTYYAVLGDNGEPLHESSDRPITYVFNGGPGAASVWLHLGTAGPFMVPIPDDGTPPPPPATVVENPETWLTATDLVFIDPIGTGFSRAAIKKKDDDKDGKQDDDAKIEDFGEKFYGVKQDIEWVGEFIRLHCTRFGRWDDRKFLAGESYGTTRAAQLASHLHNRFGMDVNGVILISTVLDFATLIPAENNLLPHVAFVPSYAVTAAYHGKTELSADEAREQAEAFVLDEYMPALLRGTSLGDEQRAAVAERYAQLTGLPVEYVLRSDLRVPPARFMKKLLNDDRMLVGRMDGRITGHDTDPVNDTPNTDPSLTGYMGPYSGAFNAYIRGPLQFESDLAYEVLSRRVRPWASTEETTGSYAGGYLNVADDLRQAMRDVPGLRVLVASGIYDLATPYYGADYTINQMNLPEELRGRVDQTYYAGGHMMYHVAGERVRLGADVRAFIETK